MAGDKGTAWDFRKGHVDTSAMTLGTSTAPNSTAGNFISSESIVLAAGPASYDAAVTGGYENLLTIGVCDTIQVQQQKGIIQLYEIGSRLPYLIPGRPTTQFQISRVLFNGDTLLASLTSQNGIAENAYADAGTGSPGHKFDSLGNTTLAAGGTVGNFYLNLASQFFNTPFGLALFFQDSERQWVGAFYAENCIVQSHSMAIQGQNMVVMENASVRCTTFKPITGPTVH